MQYKFIHLVASFALVIAISATAFARELIPLGLGPHPVATTNMEVADEYANIDAEEMDKYLIGSRSFFGSQRYIADIMKYQDATWTIDVEVPDEPEMYGPVSGETLPTLAFITYPSVPQESARSYAFPYHDSAYGTFEHMLKPGDIPSLAEPQARYPLIVLSHGGSAHGIYDIGHANRLASHGYIVAVLFYGDDRTAAMLGNNEHISFLRPLLTKSIIDSLVSSEEFGKHIDADNVGISGHSFGGFTALAAAGGAIDGNAGSVTDPRVKATVLAAPWTGGNNGQEDFYAFGPNNSGLADVSVPTISLFGSADTVTIAESILPAMKVLKGPTYVVELVDQPHVFEGGSWQDRDNWELLFFNAYLKGDLEARAMLEVGTSMQGGNVDRQLFDYQRLPSSQY